MMNRLIMMLTAACLLVLPACKKGSPLTGTTAPPHQDAWTIDTTTYHTDSTAKDLYDYYYNDDPKGYSELSASTNDGFVGCKLTVYLGNGVPQTSTSYKLVYTPYNIAPIVPPAVNTAVVDIELDNYLTPTYKFYCVKPADANATVAMTVTGKYITVNMPALWAYNRADATDSVRVTINSVQWH